MAKKKAKAPKRKKSPNTHAREQFAGLGRFVQAFEFVISRLRDDCSEIMRGGQRGVELREQPKTLLAHWNICSMPFHHELVSAKALADMWRGLIYEQCKAMVLLGTLSTKGQETANDIVKELYTDIMDLAATRNRLLHASWQIGWWRPEDDFSFMNVEKYHIGKHGLEKREDLPTSFNDLMSLGDSANKIADRMGRFMQFFTHRPEMIERVFQLRGKEWIFVPPNQRSTPPTSPKKSRKKVRRSV